MVCSLEQIDPILANQKIFQNPKTGKEPKVFKFLENFHLIPNSQIPKFPFQIPPPLWLLFLLLIFRLNFYLPPPCFNITFLLLLFMRSSAISLNCLISLTLKFVLWILLYVVFWMKSAYTRHKLDIRHECNWNEQSAFFFRFYITFSKLSGLVSFCKRPISFATSFSTVSIPFIKKFNITPFLSFFFLSASCLKQFQLIYNNSRTYFDLSPPFNLFYSIFPLSLLIPCKNYSLLSRTIIHSYIRP